MMKTTFTKLKYLSRRRENRFTLLVNPETKPNKLTAALATGTILYINKIRYLPYWSLRVSQNEITLVFKIGTRYISKS